MTVVVKKVPKFLRGFVKLIFGIKEWEKEDEIHPLLIFMPC